MQSYKILLLVTLLCLAFIGIEAAKLKSRSRLRVKSKSKAKHRLSASSKNKHRMNARIEAQGDDENIVMKGWLKFAAVPYSQWGTHEPEKFEINPGYAQQQEELAREQEQCRDESTGELMNSGPAPGAAGASQNQTANATGESDQWGPMLIPSNVHFFFVLTRKSVFALTARKNELARTRKSLEIRWLQPYQRDPNGGYKGGLEDLATWKHGACFKISVKNDAIWNICADTLAEKDKWMSAFASVMQIQGSMFQKDSFNLPEGFDLGGSSESYDKEAEERKNGAAKVDGEWVLLQDWSECSAYCGGGKSYKQRMCKPPKNGGTPCLGEAVLEKTCNTQPCPPVDKTKTRKLEPIIKMDRVAMRPQRYEICVIKEGDLALKLALANGKKSPTFPCRAVLNLKTLSIFSSANYENVYKSYDLKYLILKLSASDPERCFVVSDKRDPVGKIDELCVMPQSLRPKETFRGMMESWTNDIMYFKDQCESKNKWEKLTQEEKDKMAQLDADNSRAKLEKIRDYDVEQKAMDDANKITDAERNSVNDYQKEMDYERLLMQEELQREQAMEDAAKKALEDTANKEKCLEIERQAKAAQQKFDASSIQTDTKIAQIKKNSKINIQGEREKVLARIARMKAIAARKRELDKAKIIEVRSKIAAAIFRDNKKGDIKNCDKKKSDEEKKKYCHDQMDDVVQNQIACLNAIVDYVDYCRICCENEFGANFPKERSECAEMCDDESLNPAKYDPNGKGVKGVWVAVPPNGQTGLAAAPAAPATPAATATPAAPAAPATP